MALQEKLDKFKKQQEKCQSTLTSIAASSNATTQKSKPAARPLPATARTPAPAVKFSNDTERLQHINSIRKAPVGAQIKRVVDLLLQV
jgi:transcription initiation factor TFIIE subunit beta